MNSPICRMLGCEFPLVAFSHCRDVVAAVSKAGGFGVFGAVRYTPEELEQELAWIDAHVDGKPYGVDVIIPNKVEGRDRAVSAEEDLAHVTPELKTFTDRVLAEHGIDAALVEEMRRQRTRTNNNLRASGGLALLEVAFSHPIRLIANALGVPPREMLEAGRRHGVPVAALVGTREHAIRQAQAGVDIIVAAGGEAGGHCGEIATMVLVPEVVEALEPLGSPPVLAAGGIVTGRQMAACMAMGAAGVWCGSVWLTTAEAETTPAVKEKLLAASSRDTVRSRSRTGKHSRQLRSPWTDAWERPGAPEPLGMPYQSLVSEPPLRVIDRLAESGHAGARSLATYWVGQGVGLMNRPMSAGQVVQEFKEDYLRAWERLNGTIAA